MASLARGVTPFFTMWVRPRRTIYAIVDSNPRRLVLVAGPDIFALYFQISNAKSLILGRLWARALSSILRPSPVRV